MKVLILTNTPNLIITNYKACSTCYNKLVPNVHHNESSNLRIERGI
jgi:hypothetical protein